MPSQFNSLVLDEHKESNEVHAALRNQGVNFASGLPCGVLKYFIHSFEKDTDIIHMPGLNEPESIGLATGAWLANKTPVVYMQNSGMLKSINDIGGLMMASQSPALMLVSYRGCPGEDATQHLLTGKITIPTLDALGIEYHDLNDSKNIPETIDSCFDFMDKTGLPAALLVRRGWSKEGGKIDQPEIPVTYPTKPKKAMYQALLKINDNRDGNIIKRDETLDSILSLTNEEIAVFSTTGIMSRYIFENYDAPNQFYNCGGFGQTSAIASGFATSRRDIQTIAIDGDASLLTNFGALVTNGSRGTENLTHIVIDNGAYASCSEEKTLSISANIPLVAAIQGYKNVFLANSSKGLEDSLLKSLEIEGPNFIYMTIALGGPRNPKRPTQMDKTATRFREHFK